MGLSERPGRRRVRVAVKEGADGTRLLIMDAAAEAFIESGYGNVSMSDVVKRAGVSRGACNYHFPTKESLATALIEYFDAEMLAKGRDASSESASSLENLILSSFAQQNLIQRDPKVGIGIRLAQALDQISRTAPVAILPTWTALFADGIAGAIAEGDIVGEADGREIGYVLWCGIAGNNMVAPSVGLSLIDGLAMVWRALVRGFVPATSAAYFQQVVQRVAAQYAPSPNDADPAT